MKMNGNILWRGFLIGMISGIVLGISFKLLEHISSIPLYTLLLAIDFIPFLDQLQLGEAFEFSLHLLISCIIGVTYSYVISFTKSNHFYWIAFIITFPTFFLYFILTTISNKTSLLPTDFLPFILWIIGHGLYDVTLAFTYYFPTYNTFIKKGANK